MGEVELWRQLRRYGKKEGGRTHSRWRHSITGKYVGRPFNEVNQAPYIR